MGKKCFSEMMISALTSGTSFFHSFSQSKTKIYWVPICARHMARPGDCLINQNLLLRHSQANRGKSNPHNWDTESCFLGLLSMGKTEGEVYSTLGVLNSIGEGHDFQIPTVLIP